MADPSANEVENPDGELSLVEKINKRTKEVLSNPEVVKAIAEASCNGDTKVEEANVKEAKVKEAEVKEVKTDPEVEYIIISI